MATQFQGYDKKLNLKEATSDRDILNNLAGFPVGDDIGLFVNNLRNFSTLTVAQENIVGDTIIFDEKQPFIYTNGTEVTLNQLDSTVESYRVKENIVLLDGTKSFKLETLDGTPVTSPLPGDYVRSDAVLFSNLENLRKPIKINQEDLDKSSNPDIRAWPDTPSTLDEIDPLPSNPYESFFVTFAIIENQGGNYLNQKADLVLNIDSYTITVKESLIGNRNFTTDRNLENNNSFAVYDSKKVNSNNTPLSDENPGIYILNNVTQETRRIFSSNDNVWSEVGNNLVCASKEIVIGGSLTFDGPIKLTSPDLNTIVAPISGVIDTDFTHISKVLINDEEYFICLIESDAKVTDL